MARIVFGTDGWRGIMGQDFTLGNVRAVAQAIADYMADHGLKSRGVIVGYDTRKWSRSFADAVSGVMVGNQISTHVANRDTPTPVTAFEVLQRKAGGAVMITASHNPPEWNGIKYIPDYAGPAMPEITGEISQNITRVLRAGTVKESTIENGFARHLLEQIDATMPYIEFIESQIDTEAIKKARLRIVCDVMHGTARGYLDQILRRADCEVAVMHAEVDPNFGGSRPEPLSALLVDLKARVTSLGANLGFATDGDADRLAVYDSDGAYMAANQILPILYDYMIKSGQQGGVVRTIATTHLVDRIAENYGLPFYEVPVGFKYVGQYLRERDVVIGAEESGGFGFKGHIPEKDGIFTCIKVAEMRAKTGKPLSQLLDELQSKYGTHLSGRVGIPCSESLRRVAIERLSSRIPDKIMNVKVSNVNRMDGLKLILEDGEWLLIRPSGTEPVLRIYAESNNDERLREILEQGKNLVSTVLQQ
jgi:alpha-D-glucose phosphate-specific phosphoglucomutase